MNSNTEQARALLEKTGCTCVFAFDGRLEQSDERGLRPLLSRLGTDALPAGFSAADKVVGKAPAFLYVLLGAGEVYAPVMSRSAKELLSQHGVGAYYGQLVEGIQNRKGDGPCPMEAAVRSAATPEEALAAIRAAIRRMQQEQAAR